MAKQTIDCFQAVLIPPHDFRLLEHFITIFSNGDVYPKAVLIKRFLDCFYLTANMFPFVESYILKLTRCIPHRVVQCGSRVHWRHWDPKAVHSIGGGLEICHPRAITILDMK